MALFADTFYWIALTLPRDVAHRRVSQIKGDMVTTDEMLSEYLTFFSRGPAYLRRRAVDNVEAIRQDPTVRVIPQSHDSFLAGLELYRARPDKDYSLIDCISMQTMRLQGLSDVLTNDRHFEQEGFHAIFRDRLN
jgi:predicted nucleic acid-binding protein